MQSNSVSTPTRLTFRFRGAGQGAPDYAFSIPSRYSAGHIVTEEEAAVLNSVLVERVQDRMRPKFNGLLRGIPDGELIPPGELALLQEEIESFAERYVLGVGARGQYTKSGAVEREARAIATQLAEDQFHAEGKEVGTLAFEGLVSALAEKDSVMNLARQRVAARQKVASEAAGELDL